MNSSTAARTTTQRLARATTLVTVAVTAVLASPSPGNALAGDTSTRSERQCFIEQPHWNVALDGPVPRCPLSAAAPTPTPRPPVVVWTAGQGEVAWVGGLTRAD